MSGCTRAEDASNGHSPTELTVFAAASLKDAFEALAPEFEKSHPDVRVQFNFAGTQVLRTQLENGARPDVFASADERHPAALVKEGLLETPSVFACNTLVLVAPAQNPAGLQRFEDLPKAQRIVLAGREVPAGAYAEQVLDRAGEAIGSDFAEKIHSHVVSHELNVRQVLAKVVLGEADAALVYASDAASAKEQVRAIPVPPALEVEARYPIAVVRGSSKSESARAFVEFLSGEPAQRTLQSLGFSACGEAASR